MLSGTRLNSVCLKPKPMRIFWVLLLIIGSQNAWAGELLGRISEEDMPSEQTLSPDASPLTYRVICTPEQTDEPDCQRPPLEDGFEGLKSKPHKQSKSPSVPQSQQPIAEPSLEDWQIKSKPEQ